MGLRRLGIAWALTATLAGVVPARKAPEPAPIEPHDATLNLAMGYIGRALILRCFCAENNLNFDADGKPAGTVKPEDWTLAAVNVLKVERKAPGVIELEGARVAIRYNSDRHEFERHPQNDDKMRITIADTGDPKQFEHALATIFSVGIDLPLQRTMPDYWRHYFDPQLAWPQDDLSGQTIYVMYSAGSVANSSLTSPVVTHRADSSYTAFASRDRLNGLVRLRLVVNAQGLPQRIAIAQPLGYGLDERAIEAAAKFRFTPAMHNGAAAPSMVLLDQEYVPVTAPR
jgi:TonB family protein